MTVRTVPEPVSTFVAIPSGVYDATITKVETEEKEADMYHDKPYEQLAVTWSIDPEDIDDDEEREGDVTLRSWFTPSMNEKSNVVTKLLPALGMKAPKPTEDWDDQDWIGKSCQIQVEQFTNGAGFERNKILQYMAARKGKKNQRPAF